MVNKYGWVDTGSSFLPAEINSAFLLAQLENLEIIQKRRCEIWSFYYEALKPLADIGCFKMPDMPDYATNNAHMFYMVCNSLNERSKLINYLKENGVLAVFHYLSLHESEYYRDKYKEIPSLPHCDHFADCLVRLPMFYELQNEEISTVIANIKEFYKIIK